MFRAASDVSSGSVPAELSSEELSGTLVLLDGVLLELGTLALIWLLVLHPVIATSSTAARIAAIVLAIFFSLPSVLRIIR
jgi:hypothetical protein